MHPGIRVFPSAEGDLSPLTVRDAALISHDLLLAAPSVKHDTITIARDHLPLAGIKVSKR
jgi:hypothetical protein